LRLGGVTDTTPGMTDGEDEQAGSGEDAEAVTGVGSKGDDAGPPRPALLAMLLGMMLTGAGAALSTAQPAWPGLALALSGAAVCAIGIVGMLRSHSRRR
jgi:hypothetical protein